MATYLNRSKLYEESVSNSVSSSSLNLNGAISLSTSSTTSSLGLTVRDLICPVCRALLREPVTLPCNHNLCLGCLRASLSLKNSSGITIFPNCPLCGQKLGSWLKSKKKHKLPVNIKLWKLICQRFPKECETNLAAGVLFETSTTVVSNSFVENNSLRDIDLLSEKLTYLTKYSNQEDEANQKQVAEEEMRQQQQKLVAGGLLGNIKKEDKHNFMQLAQKQFVQKTEKNDFLDQTIDKYDKYHSETVTMFNLNKTKLDVYQIQSAVHQKVSSDLEKQNDILSSKIQSEKLTTSLQEFVEPCELKKSESIHNAVNTKVVTHQNQFIQSNISEYLTFGKVSASSKIYGMQAKEELHVPNDIINNKKKKLGVEVCITNIKGEERIGSAESAGSHDSINQEIHHFKPIKPLPRTPLKINREGKQIDPKIIRVLPIVKKVYNVVPKPPASSYPKVMIGCSWSAFERVLQHQHLFLKKFPLTNKSGIIKTEKKFQHICNISKSSKTAIKYQLNKSCTEVPFDTNKNYYPKNISRTANGIEIVKKLNINDRNISKNSDKQHAKHISKVKNVQLLPRRVQPEKEKIEVAQINETEKKAISSNFSSPTSTIITLKDQTLVTSPTLEIIENIAERIKKRNTLRITNYHENNQMNKVTKKIQKNVNKKLACNQKMKKSVSSIKPKVKTKVEKEMTLTSREIKLAAQSSKKLQYPGDPENLKDYHECCRLPEPQNIVTKKAHTSLPLKKYRKSTRNKKIEEIYNLDIGLTDNLKINYTEEVEQVSKISIFQGSIQNKEKLEEDENEITSSNVYINTRNFVSTRALKKVDPPEDIHRNGRKPTALIDHLKSGSVIFQKSSLIKKSTSAEDLEKVKKPRQKKEKIVVLAKMNKTIDLRKTRFTKKPTLNKNLESDEENPKPEKKLMVNLKNKSNLRASLLGKIHTSNKKIYNKESDIEEKDEKTFKDNLILKSNTHEKIQALNKTMCDEYSKDDKEKINQVNVKAIDFNDGLNLTKALEKSQSLKEPGHIINFESEKGKSKQNQNMIAQVDFKIKNTGFGKTRSSKKLQLNKKSESREKNMEHLKFIEQSQLHDKEKAKLEKLIKNPLNSSTVIKKYIKSLSISKNKKCYQNVKTHSEDNNYLNYQSVDLEVKVPKRPVKKCKRNITQMLNESKTNSNIEMISAPMMAKKPTPNTTTQKSENFLDCLPSSMPFSQFKKSRVIKYKNKIKSKEIKENSISVKNKTNVETHEEITVEQRHEQERRDLELALQLQEQFNAMSRIAGRTRRGVAKKQTISVLNDN